LLDKICLGIDDRYLGQFSLGQISKTQKEEEMIGYFPQGKVFICLSGEYKGLAFFLAPFVLGFYTCAQIVGGELSGLPTLLHTNIFLV